MEIFCMNKQNSNRYKYLGENKITYHSSRESCDIIARWSGSHYYFVKTIGCEENCNYPHFPYRLSRYDKERLQLRRD